MDNKIKLNDPEDLYKSVFMNMLDGLSYHQMLFDVQGNPIDFIYLKVNKNFEELTGLKNVIGKRVTAVIPGIDKSNHELLETYGRVALGGMPEKFETYVEPLAKWFLISAYSPKRTFFVTVFQNITYQKQTAKDLSNSMIAARNVMEDLIEASTKEAILIKDLNKFKLAMDNVSESIVITDPEGIAIYANKATEKITGYKIKDIISKKNGTLWKKPMPVEYYKSLWHTIKDKKQVFRGEIQNKRKTGEIYTAAINISPILNKKAEIEFFVSIERDISKEKEIERAKSEFVSIASHELRTPLTAIDGLVSMILDGEYGMVNEGLKQPLKDVNISSERLIHLVNDLLSLSRIQAGKLKFTLSEFSISHVITETVHLLQPVSKQKGLSLTATMIKPVLVQCDINKLKEILNNLIGNSCKFTIKGGIIVSTIELDETLEIHITDTGIGITKENQDKLFGKFQQLETDQGRVGGTGLGLNISKTMACKMGGDLWVKESEIGVGSTFVFSVPKAASELAEKVKKEIERE